ncbi:MAG TPA: hypothetical protein VK934_00540 [Fimbriimonas sp.]|nr:hypothetical protein [Fimbriimonas sp.]
MATKPVSAAAFVSTESYKYQSLAISLGNAPSFLADAKGDSLLTINLLSSFRRETDDYLAATRFDTGGTKAKTRCWLAKLPVDYLGTGLGARFEGNKIRSWALLSKRSGFGLTLVNPWRLTEYEAEVSGQSNVFHEKSHSDLMLPSHARVVNYWPETRQLIVECFGMVYKLDKGGRVVAAIERESRSDTEAEWLLSSETSAANGGREAWLPLAHSSNRKLWLVQSRSTGERSLLKFR